MDYKQLNNMLIVNDCDILLRTNQDNENVIIERKKDCILTITSQNNNWLRKNYYYKNGDYEEMYER